MNIVFKNNGVISLLDLTSMGDSIKRNDASKVGKFDSGLKYAIAILYRNGIKVEINSGGFNYKFSSEIISDENTGKRKELLIINRTDSSGITSKHITAFSTNLGHEWKVWMAIRELYSNCLDEDGVVLFGDKSSEIYDTEVIVYPNELVDEIISNWDHYFLSARTPIQTIGNISIYENEDECLRLYKQGFLIHEDLHVKSKFVYDYTLASIDEMRMLNDENDFRSSIVSMIVRCTNEYFISKFINETTDDELFEANLNWWSGFSQEWINVVNLKFLDSNTKCNNALKNAFIDCDKMDIGIRRVSTNCTRDYYWDKSKVEVVPNTVEKERTFEEIVQSICNEMKFPSKYPIVESKIDNYVALPDLAQKVIYVSKDLNKDNFWQFVKATFRIDGNDEGNYVFKEYVKLLNK